MASSTRPPRALVLLALTLSGCAGGVEPVGIDPGSPQLAPIPAPSGQYAVGTILMDVDDPRPPAEVPAGIPTTIAAQVWYPAVANAEGARAPYIARPDQLEAMLRDGYLAQTPDTIASWAGFATHAMLGVLPAVSTGGFPLLLFSPAEDVALAHYGALLQELASRGMVVIGVHHRHSGRAAPSPFRRTSSSPALARVSRGPAEDVARLAADLSLVLRRFTTATGTVGAVARRADLTRAGAFGHSIGGAVALETCALERVLRRCASLDGAPIGSWLERGLTRPMLVVRSAPEFSDADFAAGGRTRADWVQADERARSAWLDLLSRPDAAGGSVARLRGTVRMSFSDAPFVMPGMIARAGGRPTHPVRLLDVTASLLESFFGAEPDALAAAIGAIAARYPEVELES